MTPLDPIVVATAGWVAGWYLWGRPRRLAPPASPTTAAPDLGSATPAPAVGPVAVIIPARDEAKVLPGLLADLQVATTATGPRQVIVVDDHSTDGTAAAARSYPDVTVIDAPELPPGWTGKSWACHVGVQSLAPAADTTVVFVDADVRVAPEAIDAAVETVRHEGGMVSVQPFHTVEHPYEELSLYPGVMGLLGTGAGRRSHDPIGGFGPLIASSLTDYRTVGGHASVAGAVTEDVALGLRYRRAGLPVSIRLGGPLVRFRMYPAGRAQLVEGWTKNMATGAGSVPLHRTLLVALWITAAGTAALHLPYLPTRGAVPASVGVALYAAFAAQLALFARTTGTFRLIGPLLYPIQLVAFMALFLRSVWHIRVRRAVRWRGRTISVGDAGHHP